MSVIKMTKTKLAYYGSASVCLECWKMLMGVHISIHNTWEGQTKEMCLSPEKEIYNIQESGFSERCASDS